MALIDDIDVGVENFTFPDFLIFVSQRKKGNGALKLFEEYDTGKILSLHFINITFFPDKNSKLDPEEVQWWLENHGKYVTEKQAKKIVEQMDFDGDGFCDYNDFLAVILARILTIKLKQS